MIKAYWAAEHEAEMKRRTKRQEQVIKRWQRLIQGLRIRQRLQEQYAGKGPQQSTEHSEEAEQLEQVSNTLSQCNLCYRLLRPGRSRTNKGLEDSSIQRMLSYNRILYRVTSIRYLIRRNNSRLISKTVTSTQTRQFETMVRWTLRLVMLYKSLYGWKHTILKTLTSPGRFLLHL